VSAAFSLPELEPGPLKVVGKRVDGLTLRYRVVLDPLFVEALHKRSRHARKHGRASFTWRLRVPEGLSVSGDRKDVRLGGLRQRWADEAHDASVAVAESEGIWGEMRYSRDPKIFHVTNQPYFRLKVDTSGAGACETLNEITGEFESDPGFTIEFVFYAQWLAEVGLDAALREAWAIASLCGKVEEQRLGRIDLCVDAQGWAIGEEDVRCLVKRPRARWQKEYGDVAVDKSGKVQLLRVKKGGRASKEEREEEVRAQDFGRGALNRRQITGLSVGRGGAMMTRIYDKRVELERDEERRANEEARWSAGGWDGVTGVTRVEFQIRGQAVREFGILDPSRAKDVIWGTNVKTGRDCVIAQKDILDESGRALGLVDRLDWLWRSCLEWVKLVEPSYTRAGKMRSVSRLKDDARWALLREVQFADARAPSPIKRFRVRGVASAAMSLGVALSQLARDGKLVLLSEEREAYGDGSYESEVRARAELHQRVHEIMQLAAENIYEAVLLRTDDAIDACVHFATRSNAALYRHKVRRLSDALVATGPPDGDGPRSRASSRGGGAHTGGGREARKAVA
jgi:hypothetical protein